MEKDAITQKCIRCGTQHRVLDMVMDASGRGMACRACAGLARRAPSAARESAPIERRSFLCADCNYRFKSSRTHENVTCGYCGSSRVLSQEQSNANAILSQAQARRFDR